MLDPLTHHPCLVDAPTSNGCCRCGATRGLDGVPDAAGSTADMAAIVTREVLKQLGEDRDATCAADVTPTAPAPSGNPAPEVAMAGANIERDNPMDFAVGGAISTLMDDKCEPAPNTCVPFHTTALGADLPECIKAKIWAN